MSAEKEIVNYWYNKRGFFTINNIKTSNNKDCGILALRFDHYKVSEILHIGISCSITNNIADYKDLRASVNKVVKEKFEENNVKETVHEQLGQFSLGMYKIKNVIVLGAVTKSRKSEITKEFDNKNVEVMDFENILFDIFEQLDTQYYRNDIIRTLQLTKFLLLNEPTKLAKFIVNDSVSSASRKEFLASLLEKDQILKEFKKTNVERLSVILKNSGLKPSELAHMIEHNILNKRTRKLFFDSLTEQEKVRKDVNNVITKKNVEISLEKFFS